MAIHHNQIRRPKFMARQYQQPVSAPVIVPTVVDFPKVSDSILLTGGIGDFLTVESLMSTEHRNAISTVCYATRQNKSIKNLFLNISEFFPNLKNHNFVWDDFSEFWAFQNKNEVLNKNPKLPNCEDWSIDRVFKNCESILPTAKSSFLNKKLANISKFNISEPYLCVCSSSTDNRMTNRYLTMQEWDYALSFGKKLVLVGVVPSVIPNDIIDLTGKTTLLEAIEILKHACGYIGIDSCLSVLAAKLFTDNLLIKSNNDHCYNYKHVYYAPKTNFDFLKNSLGK